ncbi:energy transducer TonB [Bacteroidetes/Chlorobi group bacterium ChocPot_Mid]|nr:MAG: energy transducer TonB [Bacteroidetes/Chlorobi group bacterium ChocPot_Mid]
MISVVDVNNGTYKKVGTSNIKVKWYTSSLNSYPIVVEYQDKSVKVLPFAKDGKELDNIVVDFLSKSEPVVKIGKKVESTNKEKELDQANETISMQKEKLVNNSVSKKTSGNNETDEVYFVAVEEMPEPIGGIEGIQERIIYPESAKRAGIQGKIFLKAYLNEKGEIDKVELIRGIDKECDEMAIKTVKETKFKPGKQKGKFVKTQLTIPIVFKL